MAGGHEAAGSSPATPTPMIRSLKNKDQKNDNALFRRLLRQRKKEQAIAITRGKKAAKKFGKEPFDWERFDELYDVSHEKIGSEPSQQIKAQYEEKYYDHPEIVTMKAFADFLNEMDVWKDWQPIDPEAR